MMNCVSLNQMCMYFRGIPGIDWQDNDADASRITTVYYNSYDANSNSTAGDGTVGFMYHIIL